MRFDLAATQDPSYSTILAETESAQPQNRHRLDKGCKRERVAASAMRTALGPGTTTAGSLTSPLLGEISGFPRHPPDRGSPGCQVCAVSYQTPGTNLHRTRLRYALYSSLVASSRSSATARPTLQPDANTITRALRREMLWSTYPNWSRRYEA